MWLVQLQYHGCDPWTKVICGCDSEEAAHNAGQKVVWYYNNPFHPTDDTMAGVMMSMFDFYNYAVKYHEGEWI
jgi:hypothetical protein|nr:MAG TPA: hypothetical protein [Caudoviricetes sp.]